VFMLTSIVYTPFGLHNRHSMGIGQQFYYTSCIATPKVLHLLLRSHDVE